MHSDREKINQLPFVLDFYNELFNSAGITHHTPIRHIRSNKDITEIVSKYGISAIKLDCLFSGTYYDQEGKILFDKHRLSDYVRKYIADRLIDLPDKIVLKCSSIS